MTTHFFTFPHVPDISEFIGQVQPPKRERRGSLQF